MAKADVLRDNVFPLMAGAALALGAAPKAPVSLANARPWAVASVKQRFPWTFVRIWMYLGIVLPQANACQTKRRQVSAMVSNATAYASNAPLAGFYR